jgi:hypothetical protein
MPACLAAHENAAAFHDSRGKPEGQRLRAVDRIGAAKQHPMAVEWRKVWFELADRLSVEPVEHYTMSFAQLVLMLGYRERGISLVEIEAAGMPFEMGRTGILDQRPPGGVGMTDQPGEHAGDALHLSLAA